MIERLLFSSENGNKNWFYIFGKWLNVSNLTVCSPSASLIFQWITITRFTQTYFALDVMIHDTTVDSMNKSSLHKSSSKRSISGVDNASWNMYGLALCANGATKVTSIDETSFKYLKIDTTKLQTYITNDVYCKEVLAKLASNIKQPILFDKKFPIHYILGYTESHTHKYLLEIIVSMCKDIIEKKAEQTRKKRRKDTPKVNLLKVFSCLVENDNLDDSINVDTLAYYKEFIQFLDMMVAYMPNVSNDIDEHLLYSMKVALLKTIQGIADALYKSDYTTLLSDSSRMTYFNLIYSWLNYALNPESLRIHCCATLTSLLKSKTFLAPTTTTTLSSGNNTINDVDIISLLEIFMSNFKSMDMAYQLLLIIFDNKEDVSKIVYWMIEKCLKSDKMVNEILIVILGEYFEKLHLESMRSLILPLFLLFSQSNDEKVLYAVRDVVCFIVRTETANYESLQQDLDFIHKIGVDQFRNQFNHTISKILVSQTYSVINCLHKFYTISNVNLHHNILQVQCCWLENVDFKTIKPAPYNSNIIAASVDDTAPSSTRTKSKATSAAYVASNHRYQCTHKQSVTLISNLFYITRKHHMEYPETLRSMWTAVIKDHPLNLRYILEILLSFIQNYSYYILESVRIILSVVSADFLEKVIHFLMLNLTIESAFFFCNISVKFGTTAPQVVLKFGRNSTSRDINENLVQQQPSVDTPNDNSKCVGGLLPLETNDDFWLSVYKLLDCSFETVDMLKHTIQAYFIPKPIAAVMLLSDLLLAKDAFVVLGEDVISVIHFCIVGLTHENCTFIVNQCKRALVFVLITCYHSISELFSHEYTSQSANIDSLIHHIFISLSPHCVLSSIVHKYMVANAYTNKKVSSDPTPIKSINSDMDSNVGLEYLDQLVAESNAKIVECGADTNNSARLNSIIKDMEVILLWIFEIGNSSQPSPYSSASGYYYDVNATVTIDTVNQMHFPRMSSTKLNLSTTYPHSLTVINQFDLGVICRKISLILSATDVRKTFKNDWVMVCMNWALNHSSRFISQTSFQIYQLLEIPMTLEDMYCLNERLLEGVNEFIDTQQRNKNMGTVKPYYSTQNSIEFDLMKIYEPQFELLLAHLSDTKPSSLLVNNTAEHPPPNEKYNNEMITYFLQLAIMWLNSSRPMIFVVGLRIVRLLLGAVINHHQSKSSNSVSQLIDSLMKGDPSRWEEVCPNFPGLLILVGRGILIQNDAVTCDSVVQALCEMLPYLDRPLICTTSSRLALLFHTLILLPYLVETYENPTHFQFTATNLYAKITTTLIDENNTDYALSSAITKINQALSIYSEKNNLNQLEAWLEMILTHAFGDHLQRPHVIDVAILFALQLTKNESIVNIFSLMHIFNAIIKISPPSEDDVMKQLTDSISLISNKYLDDSNICKLSMDILHNLINPKGSTASCSSHSVVAETTLHPPDTAFIVERISYLDWPSDNLIINTTCYSNHLVTLVKNIKSFIVENKLCDSGHQVKLQSMFEEFVGTNTTKAMFRDVFSRERAIYYVNDSIDDIGDESTELDDYSKHCSSITSSTALNNDNTSTVDTNVKRSESELVDDVVVGDDDVLLLEPSSSTAKPTPQTTVSEQTGTYLLTPFVNSNAAKTSSPNLSKNNRPSLASVEVGVTDDIIPTSRNSVDSKNNQLSDGFDIAREMEEVFNNFKFLDEEFYDDIHSGMAWNDHIDQKCSSTLDDHKVDTTIQINESPDRSVQNTSFNDESTLSTANNNLDYSENDTRFCSKAKISYEDIKVALRKHSSFDRSPQGAAYIGRKSIQYSSPFRSVGDSHTSTDKTEINRQSLNCEAIKIYLQIDPVNANLGELIQLHVNDNSETFTYSLARICLLASDILNCVVCDLDTFIKTILTTTIGMEDEFKEINPILESISTFMEKTIGYIPQLLVIPVSQVVDMTENLKDHSTVIANQMLSILQQISKLKSLITYLDQKGILSGADITRWSFSCDFYLQLDHQKSNSRNNYVQFVDTVSSPAAVLMWTISEVVDTISSYNACVEFVAIHFQKLRDILCAEEVFVHFDAPPHISNDSSSSKSIRDDVMENFDVLLQLFYPLSGNKVEIFQRFRLLIASLKYGDMALQHLSNTTSDTESIRSVSAVPLDTIADDSHVNKNELKLTATAGNNVPTSTDSKSDYVKSPSHATVGETESKSSVGASYDEVSKETCIKSQLNVVTHFYRPIIETIMAMEEDSSVNAVCCKIDRNATRHVMTLSKLIFSLKALL